MMPDRGPVRNSRDDIAAPPKPPQWLSPQRWSLGRRGDWALECDLRHIGPAEVAVSPMNRRRLPSQPPRATGPAFEFLARGLFLPSEFFLRSRAWVILRGMCAPADPKPATPENHAAALAAVPPRCAPFDVTRSPGAGGADLRRGLEGSSRLESDPADGPPLSAPSQLLRPI
jgi:hypothetical protein